MNMKLTKDEKKAIPFVLPGLLLSFLLIAYPLVYIITKSFSNNSFVASSSGFAGFQNYISLFRNPQFSMALKNTFKFTFGSVCGGFIIGLVLALLINSKNVRFKGFWRSLVFIAWVIPGVVRATTFKWMYQTDGGILNHMLMLLGMITDPIPWLTNSKYAIWSLVLVQIWSTAPYVMLMTTASLQQIPRDLYESAEIDGAGGLRRFFSITLPSIREICFLVILLLLIWALNEFSLIWVTTSGGQNTSTLSILIYNQFKVLNLNGASASAVMQLILTMFFAGLYIKLKKKEAM